MSTQFPTGPTRNVQAGDTPDLNDGLLSRKITGPISSSKTILRGQASILVDGEVTVAVAGTVGFTPFVPVESVTATGTSAAAVEEPISGVGPDQRVALTIGDDTVITTLNPGDYVKISDVAGQITKMLAADPIEDRYARFLGIEAALLDKNTASPFDETLTPGIVPDQPVTVAIGETAVGWFQLIESQGVLA